MSRNCWLFIVALVGWITLAASQPQKSFKNEQPGRNPTTQQLIALVTRLPIESAQPSPPSEHDQPCRQGQQNRNSELCAEWHAADQAEEAAKWAGRSFWVGIIGASGLFVTLWFNLEAWRQGRDGRRDTEKALAAAEKSADATSRNADLMTASSDRQVAVQRAYVLVEGVEVRTSGEKGKRHTMVVVFRNYGITPAVRFHDNISYMYIPNELFEENLPTSSDKPDPLEIATVNSGQAIFGRVNFPSEDIYHVLTERGRVFISCYCRYEDIFSPGVEHYTRQVFESAPNATNLKIEGVGEWSSEAMEYAFVVHGKHHIAT